MTARQIELVQATWKQLSQNADELASLFYDRLFEVNPQLKPMFKSNMAEQHRKLVMMIAAAVQSLNDFDKLKLAVQELGKRHIGYGVQKEHYQAVGEALLWSLERSLRKAFTEEARLAWATFYGRLAETMQTQLP